MVEEKFVNCYNEQIKFQQEMLNTCKYDFLIGAGFKPALPVDNSKLCSYHIQQLISEVGEVLSSDKRWKSHRSETTKDMLEHKKEELADCFIVLMNLCIFSGLSAEEILNKVNEKIKVNFDRLE